MIPIIVVPVVGRLSAENLNAAEMLVFLSLEIDLGSRFQGPRCDQQRLVLRRPVASR
jgi:hypothetical protein